MHPFSWAAALIGVGKCCHLVYRQYAKALESSVFFPKPEPRTKIHISVSQLVADGKIE